MREGLIVEVPENFANKSGDYDLIIRQTDYTSVSEADSEITEISCLLSLASR